MAKESKNIKVLAKNTEQWIKSKTGKEELNKIQKDIKEDIDALKKSRYIDPRSMNDCYDL